MNINNYIKLANKAANLQINELKKIKKVFNKTFIQAVDVILNCKGKVIFAGIGKSGLIARKISATFSSIGIPSFFCDPAQALHGDMGQIEKKDILIIFSNSGNTSELTNMLKYANRFRIKVIGVASKSDSLLLKASDIFIMLSENTKTGDVEGFGIAILEANALGIPAIGAANCGIEDAISNFKSGILVSYDSCDEFSKSIQTIMENYDDYSKNALSWAESHKWNYIIKDYIELINS